MEPQHSGAILSVLVQCVNLLSYLTYS